MFNLWEQLKAITGYEYESAPGSDSVMGWEGSGAGAVTADDSESPDILYFSERGEFTLAAEGRTVETQNEFIWKRMGGECIKLSHSRFGRDKQVELFDLVYDHETDEWRSEAAHVCGDDLYSGSAKQVGGAIHFDWSISGPRKQEHLHYTYTRSSWDT